MEQRTVPLSPACNIGSCPRILKSGTTYTTVTGSCLGAYIFVTNFEQCAAIRVMDVSVPCNTPTA